MDAFPLRRAWALCDLPACYTDLEVEHECPRYAAT